jgi:hypothetical protein
VSSGRSGSRIVRVGLGRDTRRVFTMRHSRLSQYLSVAAAADRVLYVVSYRCSQALHVMDANGSHDHVLLRGRGPLGSGGCGQTGTPAGFWTVALAKKVAYLTKLAFHSNGSSTPTIVRVGL